MPKYPGTRDGDGVLQPPALHVLVKLVLSCQHAWVTPHHVCAWGSCVCLRTMANQRPGPQQPNQSQHPSAEDKLEDTG